jgi:hypothetical protein
VKIKVTEQMIELDGTPMELPGTQRCPTCNRITESQPFTLRLAFTTALVAQFRDETLKESDQVTRYALAMRIYNEDEPDLSSDDAVLIKRLVSKMRGPMVAGPVCNLLTFKEEKSK